MTRRRKAILVVLAIIILCVGGVVGYERWRMSTPEYLVEQELAQLRMEKRGFLSRLVGIRHELGKTGDRVAMDLAALGSPAVPSLIQALKDRNDSARACAAWAMREICDDRSVEGLIGALSDRSDCVRFFAADALGKLGDGRAVEPLIALLRDGSFRVQQVAARSLGMLGDPRAIRPLEELLSDKTTWIATIAYDSSTPPMENLGTSVSDLAAEALRKLRQNGVSAAVSKPATRSSGMGELDRLAEQYVERLRKAAPFIFSKSGLLENKAEAHLRSQVANDVRTYAPEEMAAFILVKGEWKRTLWYKAAEEAYARAWAARMAGKAGAEPSKRTFDALAKLAEKGSYRETRVSAALCLKKLQPSLAEKTLKHEYGTVFIPDSVSASINWWMAGVTATGPHLTDFGLRVPTEVTSTMDVKCLLRGAWGDETYAKRVDRDGDDWGKPGGRVLRLTGKLYNEHMRGLLKAGKLQQLKALEEKTALREKLAVECFEKAENIPPPTGPGLFEKGESPDEP